MAKTIKRIFYAFLISVLIVFAFPYFYFYFKPQTNSDQIPLINPNYNNENPPDFGLKAKLRAKITITPSIWSNIFEIDKGEMDGVLYGNIVTDTKGQVIGIVSLVNPKSSQITSITNPNAKLTVWIKKPSNKGLLSGLYGYSTQVDWIQDGEDLENQPVFTSNLSKNSQDGLYIGKVQSVKLGISGSFYVVKLNDLTNIWQSSGTVLVW